MPSSSRPTATLLSTSRTKVRPDSSQALTGSTLADPACPLLSPCPSPHRPLLPSSSLDSLIFDSPFLPHDRLDRPDERHRRRHAPRPEPVAPLVLDRQVDLGRRLPRAAPPDRPLRRRARPQEHHHRRPRGLLARRLLARPGLRRRGPARRRRRLGALARRVDPALAASTADARPGGSARPQAVGPHQGRRPGRLRRPHGRLWRRARVLGGQASRPQGHLQCVSRSLPLFCVRGCC